MPTKIIEGLDSYQLDAWAGRLGSPVVSRVAHDDRGGSYEMNCIHVLKLKNRHYAVVTESGCSCYSSDDAVIDLHPDKKKAMNAFDKWQKEN